MIALLWVGLVYLYLGGLLLGFNSVDLYTFFVLFLFVCYEFCVCLDL